MRINRLDEREGDIDFDFPSRERETKDVSRTKMNMWMGQAGIASGAIPMKNPSRTVQRMRSNSDRLIGKGLLRVYGHCSDHRDQL